MRSPTRKASHMAGLSPCRTSDCAELYSRVPVDPETGRIECSIDVDQNLGLAIAADPILLTAVAVMRQTEIDVFAALGDVID
jgi:hypothetical protein